MDPTKSKSRGISCDMSQAAIERRLETVDELRELAIALSQAERLGPIVNRQTVSESPASFAIQSPQDEE